LKLFFISIPTTKKNRNKMNCQTETKEFATETHAVCIEHAVIPLGKKQDYITSGTCIDEDTGETCNWIAAFDGHGTDDVIQTIRNMDMTSYVCSSNPIQKIEQHIESVSNLSKHTYFNIVERHKTKWMCSGSTVSIVKVFTNKIVCMNSGDSQTAVFIDDDLVYINTPHTMDNMAEVERVKRVIPDHYVLHVPKYAMSTATSMKKSETTYIVYSEPERMCMVTQSLGHLQMLPCDPEVKTLEYKQHQNIVVFVGTDGFFDMTLLDDPNEVMDMKNNSAFESATKVEQRWAKQDWQIEGEEGGGGFDEKNRDDIGVGKLSLIAKHEAKSSYV
jgi:serine/threonine protein phosphatase PrpC